MPPENVPIRHFTRFCVSDPDLNSSRLTQERTEAHVWSGLDISHHHRRLCDIVSTEYLDSQFQASEPIQFWWPKQSRWFRSCDLKPRACTNTQALRVVFLTRSLRYHSSCCASVDFGVFLSTTYQMLTLYGSVCCWFSQSALGQNFSQWGIEDVLPSLWFTSPLPPPFDLPTSGPVHEKRVLKCPEEADMSRIMLKRGLVNKVQVLGLSSQPFINANSRSTYWRAWMNWLWISFSEKGVLPLLALKQSVGISIRTVKRLCWKQRLLWRMAAFMQVNQGGNGRMFGYQWVDLRPVQTGYVASRQTIRQQIKLSDPVMRPFCSFPNGRTLHLSARTLKPPTHHCFASSRISKAALTCQDVKGGPLRVCSATWSSRCDGGVGAAVPSMFHARVMFPCSWVISLVRALDAAGQGQLIAVVLLWGGKHLVSSNVKTGWKSQGNISVNSRSQQTPSRTRWLFTSLVSGFSVVADRCACGYKNRQN